MMMLKSVDRHGLNVWDNVMRIRLNSYAWTSFLYPTSLNLVVEERISFLISIYLYSSHTTKMQNAFQCPSVSCSTLHYLTFL